MIWFQRDKIEHSREEKFNQRRNRTSEPDGSHILKLPAWKLIAYKDVISFDHDARLALRQVLVASIYFYMRDISAIILLAADLSCIFCANRQTLVRST